MAKAVQKSKEVRNSLRGASRTLIDAARLRRTTRAGKPLPTDIALKYRMKASDREKDAEIRKELFDTKDMSTELSPDDLKALEDINKQTDNLTAEVKSLLLSIKDIK